MTKMRNFDFENGSTAVSPGLEDPGLRIESFAVINLRGVSTNKTIYFIAMQTYKELTSMVILTLRSLSLKTGIF